MHLGWSPSACKAFGPFCSVEPVATCGILFAISPCEPCHIARPGAIHVDPGVALNAVLTCLDRAKAHFGSSSWLVSSRFDHLCNLAGIETNLK